MDKDGNIRIIVAEDDPLLRETLCLYLSGEGRVVHEAADGVIAANIFNTLTAEGTQVDVISTDRNMPNMGGEELLAVWVIKSDTQVAKFMYSGQESNESKEDMERAMAAARSLKYEFTKKPDYKAHIAKIEDKISEIKAGQSLAMA